MSYANPNAIVSTGWLAEHLSAPDVRVVDASYHMPASGRDARAEYEHEHIPGAVFFDINDIADHTNPLPHMLPEAAKFASKVRKLGLGNGNRVIVYDHASGSAAAARVWWMFRLFGHDDVSVLDGGMAKWLAEGRPVEDLPPMPRERHFMPRVNQLLVRSKDQVKANIDSGREQVIDARSPSRFAGRDVEPWPHTKVGHIPGSLNLPWPDLLDADSKTFLPAEALAQRFAKAGIDIHKPAVASCGSGVTACMLALGLALLGNNEAAVYDGSWAEWGLADDTPALTA
ncbi:MAG TPA: 3-mercaptopyruvate sulfurtransferase [Patescibacteria group bacterium]|nr:3-mercaptopyruvate sulfurtransferase [Patescibacteria group bacterium]